MSGRRTPVTEERFVKASQASAVLNGLAQHAEGRTRDTTDEHYAWEQSLPQKYAILCTAEQLINASSLDIAPSDESEGSSHYVDTTGFGMSSEQFIPKKTRSIEISGTHS